MSVSESFKEFIKYMSSKGYSLKQIKRYLKPLVPNRKVSTLNVNIYLKS